MQAIDININMYWIVWAVAALRELAANPMIFGSVLRYLFVLFGLHSISSSVYTLQLYEYFKLLMKISGFFSDRYREAKQEVLRTEPILVVIVNRVCFLLPPIKLATTMMVAWRVTFQFETNFLHFAMLCNYEMVWYSFWIGRKFSFFRFSRKLETFNGQTENSRTYFP